MKSVFSFLLLLTTAFYVLPVKEVLSGKQGICMTDVDDEKEENNKKEKSKELFSFSNAFTIVKHNHSNTFHYISFPIPQLLHTIETPPPDAA